MLVVSALQSLQGVAPLHVIVLGVFDFYQGQEVKLHFTESRGLSNLPSFCFFRALGHYSRQ